MSEQRANQDYRYPMAETYLYSPVTFGAFVSSDRIPIFWGPGQYTDQYPAYSPPNPNRWRNYEHLNIPVVARFIYGNDDDTPDDDYTDDDNTGGGGDPPPFQCPGFIYEVEFKGVTIRYRRSTAFNPNNPFDSGPYGFQFTTPATTHVKWFNTYLNTVDPWEHRLIPCRIYTGTLGIDDVTVYEGPIKDCPMLITIPSRYVVWYQVCFGGGTPEGGVKTFIEGRNGLFKEGTENLDIPPRCEYTYGSVKNELDFFQTPESVPPDDTKFSEVTFTALDWFGCNDPGGPRTPPPPPTPFPYTPPPTGP